MKIDEIRQAYKLAIEHDGFGGESVNVIEFFEVFSPIVDCLLLVAERAERYRDAQNADDGTVDSYRVSDTAALELDEALKVLKDLDP